MWGPFRRRHGRGVRLQSVSVAIPYVGSATFTPDESEVKAAWALFIELATRVPIQPIDTKYGSVGEALNSIYERRNRLRQRVFQCSIHDQTPGGRPDSDEPCRVRLGGGAGNLECDGLAGPRRQAIAVAGQWDHSHPVLFCFRLRP